MRATAWRSSSPVFASRSREVTARTARVDPTTLRGMRLALALDIQKARSRINSEASSVRAGPTRGRPAARRRSRSKPRAERSKTQRERSSGSGGKTMKTRSALGALAMSLLILGGCTICRPRRCRHRHRRRPHRRKVVPAQPSPSYVWVPGSYTWQQANRTLRLGTGSLDDPAAGIRLGAGTLGDSGERHGVGRWAVASQLTAEGCTRPCRQPGRGYRAAEPGASSPGPVTGPGPRQPARGIRGPVMRCASHGIAYDSEREVCPERARGSCPSGERDQRPAEAERIRR